MGSEDQAVAINVSFETLPALPRPMIFDLHKLKLIDITSVDVAVSREPRANRAAS